MATRPLKTGATMILSGLVAITATQDWGHHDFVYGLAGHEGDWRHSETDWQAYRLNQPLIAFESAKHAGAMGKAVWILLAFNADWRWLLDRSTPYLPPR